MTIGAGSERLNNYLHFHNSSCVARAERVYSDRGFFGDDSVQRRTISSMCTLDEPTVSGSENQRRRGILGSHVGVSTFISERVANVR